MIINDICYFKWVDYLIICLFLAKEKQSFRQFRHNIINQCFVYIWYKLMCVIISDGRSGGPPQKDYSGCSQL